MATRKRKSTRKLAPGPVEQLRDILRVLEDFNIIDPFARKQAKEMLREFLKDIG